MNKAQLNYKNKMLTFIFGTIVLMGSLNVMLGLTYNFYQLNNLNQELVFPIFAMIWFAIALMIPNRLWDDQQWRENG